MFTWIQILASKANGNPFVTERIMCFKNFLLSSSFQSSLFIDGLNKQSCIQVGNGTLRNMYPTSRRAGFLFYYRMFYYTNCKVFLNLFKKTMTFQMDESVFFIQCLNVIQRSQVTAR